MAPDESPDILRHEIQKMGVAKLARLAGVKPTTLYSFCSGATAYLRSDTQTKVKTVLDEDRRQNAMDSAANRLKAARRNAGYVSVKVACDVYA
jgi:transposase-like protein